MAEGLAASSLAVVRAGVPPHARGLIQVGVNAAGSSKKETLRNVRVSTRSGPVRPGSSYNVYQFELRDRCCVSLIIPPKSRLAEINDFGTQV